ncbi:P2Y purinoceptor 14-like [Betta splendens]|uniref:P2Y purinoceptor 14-like n=1 Tax=Betta splendens TaxID=158456 RepID=A0A6P7PDF8_BETSP|nr:P2Y purinoceptor 14-like [Betta splendens]XP_055370088.1 P2Y purinoceptor 14-like [Betta splendens]
MSSFNHSNNSTECRHVDASSHVYFMLFYSVLFVVGLLLNGFTLRVYFCRAQQKASSSVTIYLKNLAAADFLISLCLPWRIMNYARPSVLVRQVYCNFGASAFYLNMYASILFMGFIAANRYLKIVHPLGTSVLQRVQAAYIISTVTWVVLLTITTSYVIVSLLTQKPLTSVPASVTCDALHSEQISLLYKVIHTFSTLIFLLVLVSLVVFYYNTSRRLSLVQRRQPTSTSSKKLAKSRRNMLVLVSVFCVCFVPYHLVRLPYAFLRNQCSWSFYLKELTVVLSVLNICFDPLIYFIFCKAFRAQLNLRNVFSTTYAAHVENTERRSSGGRGGSGAADRKTSLSTTFVQDSVV